MTDTVRLWVGTYPPDGPDGAPGTGEGIWRLDLDPVTGVLTGARAVPTPAPSFLAVSSDGRTVFAAGETSPGVVTRFTVTDDGGLVERERVASGGAGPCHIVLHPGERALYVSNYGSGSLGVVPLVRDGAGQRFVGGLAQVFEHSGSGPVTDRQEGPHVHSAIVAPGGQHLLVADLGTDEIRRYRIQDDGLLTEDGVAATLPPGTGPRQMALGPGGHLYLVGELSVTVHVLAWTDDARLEPVQVLPACDSQLASGSQVLPAHVLVAGGRVLVSVRGPDVVASFAVHDDGARLEHVADLPVGGGWPRHFAMADAPGTGVEGWLVAAVQNAGRVVALAWPPPAEAPAEGPTRTVQIPFPACVAVSVP